MRISRISVYRVELPFADDCYAWAKGATLSTADSTVVRLDTDEGLVGWGEACPLGGFYLPSFPEGIRAGHALELLETLGGPATPAVGFGFGDVVIAELLADKDLLPELALGNAVGSVICDDGIALALAAILAPTVIYVNCRMLRKCRWRLGYSVVQFVIIAW